MTDGAAGLLLLGAAVFLGASTQRLTGLGFALVASPLLVLVLGPTTGVLVANVLSLAAALVVLAQTRRHVDVRRALTLAIPAVAAIPVGVWVTRQISLPVLYVMVGGLVVLALTVVVLARRLHLQPTTRLAIGAGVASGFMNVTAGVGGPAITLYARATRWEHHNFVGTIQLYFAIVNTGSIIAKGGLPTLSWQQIVSCAIGLALGAIGGRLLSQRIAAERAGKVMLTLAFIGGLATVGKGIASW